MPLTAAQLQALKTSILANTATVLYGGVPTQIKDAPNNGDGNFAVAAWYNAAAAPDFNVFRTDVPVPDLFDQTTWANFTPTDAVPTDTELNVKIWEARDLACQGKMLNLQTMLGGRATFDAGKIKQRAGLNDATTNLPSGAAGASASGGWATILPILRRLARNIEKLYAAATTGVGTGTGALGDTGNPGLMAFEGTITGDDVGNARNLP